MGDINKFPNISSATNQTSSGVNAGGMKKFDELEIHLNNIIDQLADDITTIEDLLYSITPVVYSDKLNPAPIMEDEADVSTVIGRLKNKMDILQIVANRNETVIRTLRSIV